MRGHVEAEEDGDDPGEQAIGGGRGAGADEADRIPVVERHQDEHEGEKPRLQQLRQAAERA